MFVILSMLRIRIKKIKNGTGLHFVHSALANLKIYPVLIFFLPFSPFSLFPCAFIFYCFPNGPDAFFNIRIRIVILNIDCILILDQHCICNTQSCCYSAAVTVLYVQEVVTLQK